MDYNYTTNNMYANQGTNRLKLFAILGILLVIIVVAFYWIATHSFIDVSVPSGSASATITITNQANGKEISKEVQGNFKQLVSKGKYEVIARGEKGSSFNIVSAKGFLGTEQVNSELKPQSKREFVGNNPSPCMIYSEQLLSYACFAYLDSVGVHKPANAKRTTIVETGQFREQGVVESQFTIGGKAYMLLQLLGGFGVKNETAHNLYSVNDAKIKHVAKLPELAREDRYVLRGLKDGFVVYKSDFSNAYAYSSFGGGAQALDLGSPKEKDMSIVGMEAGFNIVARTYSDAASDKFHELDEDKSTEGTTEVVANIDGQVRNYVFPTRQQNAVPCETNTLCLLNGKVLSVYDVSETKPKLLYQVSNVQAYDTAPKGLVLVRGNEVLHVDARTGNGHIGYSLGSYTQCGIQTTKDGYVLCLINHKQNKVALAINMNENDTDSIDVKMAELIKTTGLETASIYKNYIYIVPEKGPLQYNKKNQGFEPDMKVVRVNLDAIDEAIKTIGINPNEYTVSNAYDD